MTSLYRLDAKHQKLDPVATTTFSELKLKERGDIQEWVEADPSILFPDTGDELLLITSEFDGFDKTRERLDVLGMDKGGRLVVIELKRDTSSTTAHMQAVGYAAYVSAFSFADVVGIYLEFQRSRGRSEPDAVLEAELRDFVEKEQDDGDWAPDPRLVVVAGSFRAEVLASCHWLRTHGIDISCVQISPYRIDQEVLVHVSTLLPLPEEDTILMRRKDSGRAPRSSGRTRVQRNEAWWRTENPKSSKAFFETLTRFEAWAKETGLDLQVNWTASSYVGFWAGTRCVAPCWPSKTGASVYLPDNATDGSDDTPSAVFADLKSGLAENPLVKLAWAFSYNRGANPIRATVRPESFVDEGVRELLSVTVGGAAPDSAG